MSTPTVEELGQEDVAPYQNLEAGENALEANLVGGDHSENGYVCVLCEKLTHPTRRCYGFAALGMLVLVASIAAIVLLTSFSDRGRLLHMSDLHYDPGYKPNALPGRTCACNHIEASCKTDDYEPYGRQHCDSPMPLIDSMLNMAKQVLPTPDLIVSTGDFIRHHAEKLGDPDWVYTIFNELTTRVSSAFPSSSHFFHAVPSMAFAQSYGNDDFEKNYFFNASLGCSTPQPLQAKVPGVFERMLPNLDATNKRSLACAGYYFMDLSSHLSVVVLNTVLYAAKHNPPYRPGSAMARDPMGQFAWLDNVLRAKTKQGQKVWIVGHVPPGYDSFEFAPMWLNEYVIKYMQLIETHAAIVMAQLYGHEHLNTYRLFPSGSAVRAPILISSSVSPIFGNIPTFRIVEYDRSSYELKDFVSYGSTVGGTGLWAARFRMTEEFGVPDLSAAALLELTSRLETDSNMLKKYHQRKADNDKLPWPQTGSDPNVWTEKKEVCAIKHLEQSAYEACLAA